MKRSLSLALLLIITPPVFSQGETPLGRDASAVFLTRTEFERLSSELSAQSTDVVFKRFSEAYGLNDILARVIARNDTREVMTWNGRVFEAFIKTWIVTLVLAKSGFEDAARTQFFSGVSDMGLIAELTRQQHGTDMSEYLRDVTMWTIAETLVQFGHLKASEASRIYMQLKQSSHTLHSVKLRKKIVRRLIIQNLNSISSMLSIVLGAACVGFGSVVCVPSAMNYISDTVGKTGDTLVLIQLASLVSMVITGIAVGAATPVLSIYARAKWRARRLVIRNIADHCEDLLDNPRQAFPP